MFTNFPAFAQSPNTASMIVVVVDQNGAVVKDAKVSVVNTGTGAGREAVSGDGGTATIAALSVTGAYKVTVTMTGFTTEDVTSLTLRAGETATVKVKLVASGGKSEVTVFGTAEGVRADPQIGLALESKRIDETPILGRKVSALPLLNSHSDRARERVTCSSIRLISSPALVRVARPLSCLMARATMKVGAVKQQSPQSPWARFRSSMCWRTPFRPNTVGHTDRR